MHRSSISLLFAFSCPLAAADLQPLMAVPDQVILQADFSVPGPLNKDHWRPLQGTQWKIADGVLLGQPSTPEFQASKPDHKGLEPRINCPAAPRECIARLSVRFSEGSETAIVPFVEFGHHVARIQFTRDGVLLLADHDSLKVAESTSLKYQPGRWYHLLAEVKGDEFLVQFADGPTLHARHPSYALPPPSGAPGIGIAGPKGGKAELDEVTIWSIQPGTQPDWEKTRAALPAFTPVEVKTKAVPKPQARH